jgi:bacillopeptidase F
MPSGTTDDLLKINVTHNGRPGDNSVELVTWRFRFFEDDGVTPLSNANLTGTFANHYIYLDNGDGTWSGSDTQVTTVVTNYKNVVRFNFTDGDPNANISYGTPKDYFYVVQISASPLIDTFKVQFDPDGPDEKQIFFDDMENGSDNWTSDGTNNEWEHGTPTSGPGSAYSGSNVWATDLEGDYPNNMDAWVRTVDSIYLVNDTSTLSFYQWFRSEDGSDFGYVEISTDDGNSWTQLGSSYTGDLSGSGWTLETRDISSYRYRFILIRYRFTSDGGTTDSGWYIDDVRIEGGIPGGPNEVENNQTDKIVTVMEASPTMTDSVIIPEFEEILLPVTSFIALFIIVKYRTKRKKTKK